MGRPVMTKAHPLIATGFYARKMVFLIRRSLLGQCASAQEAGCQEKKEVNKFCIHPKTICCIIQLYSWRLNAMSMPRN